MLPPYHPPGPPRLPVPVSQPVQPIPKYPTPSHNTTGQKRPRDWEIERPYDPPTAAAPSNWDQPSQPQAPERQSFNALKRMIPENPSGLLHPDVQGKLDCFLANGPFTRKDVDQRCLEILAEVPPARALNILEGLLERPDFTGVQKPSAFLVTCFKKKDAPPVRQLTYQPPLLLESVQGLLDAICGIGVVKREDVTDKFILKLVRLGPQGEKALRDFLASDLDNLRNPMLFLTAIVNTYCEDLPETREAPPAPIPPPHQRQQPYSALPPVSSNNRMVTIPSYTEAVQSCVDPPPYTHAPSTPDERPPPPVVRAVGQPPAYSRTTAPPPQQTPAAPRYRTLLHPGVQARLDALFKQRLLIREDVDDGAIKALAALPSEAAYHVLNSIYDIDLTRIRNKSAYISSRTRFMMDQPPGSYPSVDLDRVAAEEGFLPYSLQVKLDECFDSAALIRPDVPQAVLECLARIPDADVACGILDSLVNGEGTGNSRAARLVDLIRSRVPEALRVVKPEEDNLQNTHAPPTSPPEHVEQHDGHHAPRDGQGKAKGKGKSRGPWTSAPLEPVKGGGRGVNTGRGVGKGGGKSRTYRNEGKKELYASIIPEHMDEDQISDLFKPYGKVMSVKKVGKGAFVRLASHEDCCAALEALHDQISLASELEPLQLRFA
jgi:hypothetical protein